MNKRALIVALISSGLLSASAYAGCNPASTCYVDKEVSALQTLITNKGVPAGGTAGQVLAKASNTNYDTHWVTAPGGGQYTIGQNTQGGVVFFVYMDSSSVQHALIAATADETGGAMYTQAAAVSQCSNKVDGGYSDWFLPNKAQISALFNNRYAIDPNDPNGNGGFSEHVNDATGLYWSSSAVSDSAGNGWIQNFSVGNQNFITVGSTLSVRCIRAI